jgi:hypothetical protein
MWYDILKFGDMKWSPESVLTAKISLPGPWKEIHPKSNRVPCFPIIGVQYTMKPEILMSLFTIDEKKVYTPIATMRTVWNHMAKKALYFRAIMDTEHDAIIVESCFDHIVHLVIDNELKIWNRELKNIGKVTWVENGFGWDPSPEFKNKFPMVFLFDSPNHHYTDMFSAEITMAGAILYEELVKTYPDLERSELRYCLNTDL